MKRWESVEKTFHYYALILRHDLQNIVERPLPQGYSYHLYQTGDERQWMEIQLAAKEFLSLEAAKKSWDHYYGGHEGEWHRRVLFIANPEGKLVGTASAYFDHRDIQAGWLHWVAIRPEEQGKGLSKPLVSRILSMLQQMGYPYACVPTQTTTWLAVKVYMDCGFLPLPNEETEYGWRMMRTLTDHPLLQNFAPVAKDALEDPLAAACKRMLMEKYPQMIDFSVDTQEPAWAGVLLPEGEKHFWLRPQTDGTIHLEER